MKSAARALIIVLGSLGFVSVAQAQKYSLTDIGSLGGSYVGGTAVNNSGQVAGYTDVPDPNSLTWRAFRYDGTTMNELGTFGGQSSFGYGINSSGQVTGSAEFAGGIPHAFIESGGVMLDLGTLGGGASAGYAINDAGQVAGLSYTSSGEQRAFLYSNGQMINLGSLGGFSWAFGIDSQGEVTGQAMTASGGTHAFLYSAGVLSDIGSLAGDSGYSEGRAISDGYVTGQSSLAERPGRHAFLYSNGLMQDIGTLGGGWASGQGVNNLGQAVGASDVADGSTHAFLYTDGAMIDLNDQVDPTSPFAMYVTLTSAYAISDTGFIVAAGLDSRSDTAHTYLLSLEPVPLPAAAWLLLSALGGLGAVSRSRSTRRACES